MERVTLPVTANGRVFPRDDLDLFFPYDGYTADGVNIVEAAGERVGYVLQWQDQTEALAQAEREQAALQVALCHRLLRAGIPDPVDQRVCRVTGGGDCGRGYRKQNDQSERKGLQSGIEVHG